MSARETRNRKIRKSLPVEELSKSSLRGENISLFRFFFFFFYSWICWDLRAKYYTAAEERETFAAVFWNENGNGNEIHLRRTFFISVGTVVLSYSRLGYAISRNTEADNRQRNARNSEARRSYRWKVRSERNASGKLARVAARLLRQMISIESSVSRIIYFAFFTENFKNFVRVYC